MDIILSLAFLPILLLFCIFLIFCDDEPVVKIDPKHNKFN